MHTHLHTAASAVMSGRALSRVEAERLLSLLPGALAAGAEPSSASLAGAGESFVSPAGAEFSALAAGGSSASQAGSGELPAAGLPALLSVAGLAAAAGGAAPFTCGIINAKSGRCAENCAFCAQSGYHTTDAPVHALLPLEKLLERAETLAAAGVTYMGIVTSGTGPTGRDFAAICEAAAHISRRVDIKLCASLGILRAEEARALKEAGFTSYHHNLETSAGYYSRICTTHDHAVRVETVKTARAAGLRVCSGGIFGLGESWEDRLDLAETLADLDVHSIPVNFLTPIPGTPLENAAGLSPAEALAVVALFRLLQPRRDIVICGGRTRTLGEWENSLFLAGANGLMVGDYLTTRGNALDRDMAMLRELGVVSRA